VIKEKKNMN